MLLAKKKRNKNRPRPLVLVLPTTESENRLRNLYIQIPIVWSKTRVKCPPGVGGGGRGGSFQQRLFLSEFDNLPIFVCFLSILLQHTQMKFSITITSIYSEIHLSKSKWQMADGRWFQFLLYVINDVIMTYQLVLKIINDLDIINFLISSDTSIFKSISAL